MENIHVFLDILAFIGVVAGPLIAYFAAKRKIGAEVLLIDINTIKGWSEQRMNFETEIANLHVALDKEQQLRRSEREKYLKKIDEIQAELSKLKDRLRDCLSQDDDY